jgi:hypothetical protein
MIEPVREIWFGAHRVIFDAPLALPPREASQRL